MVFESIPYTFVSRNKYLNILLEQELCFILTREISIYVSAFSKAIFLVFCHFLRP